MKDLKNHVIKALAGAAAIVFGKAPLAKLPLLNKIPTGVIGDLVVIGLILFVVALILKKVQKE